MLELFGTSNQVKDLIVALANTIVIVTMQVADNHEITFDGDKCHKEQAT